MTTTRNIVAGGAAQVAVRVAGLAAATLTLPLLARHLGNAAYGRLTVILVVAALVVTAGDLGLSLLLSRDLPTGKSPEWLGRFWSARIATSLALWIGASAVVVLWPLDPEFQRGLLVALAGIPAAMFSTAIGAWFNAELHPMPTALTDLVARVTWLVGVVICVSLGLGVTAVAGAFVVTQLAAVATGLALRSDGRNLRIPRLRLEPAMLRTAAPLALIPILGIVYTRADTLILAAMASDAEVGIYGALWRVVEGGAVIAGVGGALLLPLLAGSSPDQQVERYRRGLRLVASVMFPLAMLVTLGRDPLLTLLGGEAFFTTVTAPAGTADPAVALMVLMAAMSLMAIGAVNGAFMIAQRMQREVIRHFVLTVAANIVLALWLIPAWSFMGAAVASLASEAVATAHSTIVLRNANGRLELAAALRWPLTIAAAAGIGFVALGMLGLVPALAGATGAAAATLAASPAGRELADIMRS